MISKKDRFVVRVRLNYAFTDGFRRFVPETGLVLLFLNLVWFIFKRFENLGIPYEFRPSSFVIIQQGIWFNVLLFVFFALVFYGTSFQVTPLRMLLSILPGDTRRFAKKRKSASIFRYVSDVDSRARYNDKISPDWAPIRVDSPQSSATYPPSSLPTKSNESSGQLGEQPSLSTGGSGDVVVAEIPTSSQSVGTERITFKAVAIPTQTSPTEGVDELLRAFASSAAHLANRMERRTNTYLILGIGMGLVGLTVWYLSVAHLTTGSIGAFLQQAAPRLTILVFIELLAGYFLQQYRVGVEDFKYFLSLKQRAEGNRVTYSVLQAINDTEGLKTFANSISTGLLNGKLTAGETSTAVEMLKANENLGIAAIKVMGENLEKVLKVVSKEK